ncbi:hypothetical protein LAZ67_11001547 [Cordylochernes scorpioides]|uniref:Uncharacterized protein n=1 Tax=Cordylochernes scorpioides TaxID=51811 RepID=A0ABY6KZ89_9ARAC|nr:hypothetical protein LAZ67_11001547 [Cordylochernes scorpioides]
MSKSCVKSMVIVFFDAKGIVHHEEVDAQMPEEERLSHLMKGVAKEVYRYILPRDLATTDQFIAPTNAVIDCGLGKLQLNDLQDLDTEDRDHGVYAVQDFIILGDRRRG